MNRIQFSVSLLAAGFCLAFLSASSTCSTEPSWNPAEVRSVVSTQNTNPPVRRSVFPATSSTLSRWREPRISRAVGTNRPGTVEPRGARISLVSFTATSSTLQSCDDGPDIYYPPSWTSVNPSNGTGPMAQQCSTSYYIYGINDYCSVGSSGSGKPVWCSTNTNTAHGAYCSTNVGNVTGPSQCSVYGLAGQSSNQSCSAGGSPPGVAPICSTQTDGSGNNTASICSVVGPNPLGGGVNGQCSAGSLSGNAGNAQAFCSATTGQLAPGGPNQSNNCSVVNAPGGVNGSNGPNSCSTDGNGFCSVSNPQKLAGQITTDLCSVVATGQNVNSDSQCTIFQNGAGTGLCSAFSGNPPVAVVGQAQCSVYQPGNNPPFQGPDVNGHCIVQ